MYPRAKPTFTTNLPNYQDMNVAYSSDEPSLGWEAYQLCGTVSRLLSFDMSKVFSFEIS